MSSSRAQVLMGVARGIRRHLATIRIDSRGARGAHVAVRGVAVMSHSCLTSLQLAVKDQEGKRSGLVCHQNHHTRQRSRTLKK